MVEIIVHFSIILTNMNNFYMFFWLDHQQIILSQTLDLNKVYIHGKQH
jgi:hypothetical protein